VPSPRTLDVGGGDTEKVTEAFKIVLRNPR
jgi:hypothetical protein